MALCSDFIQSPRKAVRAKECGVYISIPSTQCQLMSQKLGPQRQTRYGPCPMTHTIEWIVVVRGRVLSGGGKKV